MSRVWPATADSRRATTSYDAGPDPAPSVRCGRRGLLAENLRKGVRDYRFGRATGDQCLVGVGLFVVDGDVAGLQRLVRDAQFHEQGQDAQDGEGDEGVPDDDG